jgi:branched-chain amino acid transport system ATP-binding protein
VLKIDDLETGYGRIKVLKGVSLEVNEGEIVTLIGANGAGKTTLMKALSGSLPATEGSIEYLGQPIHRKNPAYRVRQGLVLVPEGRRILRQMTVHENLLMGAYSRKDKAQIKTDLDQVYGRFPVLADRRDLSADVLSGGEQQMLAIGRALLARPKLLMMDEPSLGLSPRIVKEVFSIITELHDSGITIFLVEQNAQKALQIADRGYVMETGSVVMSDMAQQLLCSEMLREAYLGSNACLEPGTGQ